MLSKFPKNYGVYKDAKEFVKVKLKKNNELEVSTASPIKEIKDKKSGWWQK